MCQKSCSISATNLNFGSYTQTQLDGQSQIQLTCTDNHTMERRSRRGQVSRSGGLAPQHGWPRCFLNSTINFSQIPRAQSFGATHVGTDTVPGTGNGLTQTLPVYGRIPSGQRVRDGGYEDTITATLTF